MNKRSHLLAISGVGAAIGLVILSFVFINKMSVHAAPAKATTMVDITDSGFFPSVITIEVGTTVAWTNQTQQTVHLESGSPYQLYLPAIVRGTDMQQTSISQHLSNLTNIGQQGNWADVDILPGGLYTHTFTTVGTNPYFLAADKTRTGVVIVQDPIPDFALAVQPNSQSVIPGQTVTYTVLLTPANDFAAPVTLSVSGLPTGAVANWTNNPVFPPAATALSISTALNTMTGTYDLTVSGTGGGQNHATPVTLNVVADQEQDDLPCLVVVGQQLPPTQPLPPRLVGCVSGSPTTVWRYDYRGAFIGFDITITDAGVTVLTASINIERATSGRTLSYSGTVSALHSPDYFEDVSNTYNSAGGLIGADVSKIYSSSGNGYSMQITKYCPSATFPNMSGYKVNINGQEKVVGSCP